MKGSIPDLLVAVVILAVFFVALFFGLKLYNELSGESFWSETGVGTTASNSIARSFNVFDYGFLLLFAGSMIATLASAFFVQQHPVFFVVSLLILIFVIAISPPISNTFMSVATDSEFTSEAAELDITMRVMGDLPILLTIFGFLLVMVMYSKKGGGGL